MKVKRKKIWAVFLLIILCGFFVSVAGRTVLDIRESVQADTNDRRTTTGSADCEFRADGITDKDKFHTADIFSGCGSDFGGRQSVSPVFSGTAADTYRGQPGDYLLYS